MSAELCDYVLERDDSAALLDRVVRANLFVVALDEDGLWWRYHALFAEYLQRRLGDRASALHRRAARWFERHGLHEDAVDHAAACGDVELIARTVEAESVLMARSGRAATIERWLALLRATWSACDRACSARARSPPGGLARPRVEVRRMLSRAEHAREQHPEQWTGFHETARLLLAVVYGDDDVHATTLELRRGRSSSRGRTRTRWWCPRWRCSRGPAAGGARTTPRSSSPARPRSIRTLTGGRSVSSRRSPSRR